MTKLTRAGFIIAIAGGLLTVAPFLAEPYMLTKLFALALGAALAWAGLIGRSPRGTALDLPLAALWLVMLASAAGSVDPAVSALGMYPQQFYGLLPLLPCVALFYAAAACDGAEAEEFVSKIFVRTAIALSAFGLVQLAAMRVMLTRGRPLPAQRATSTRAIGSPVMLGGCLASCCRSCCARRSKKRAAPAGPRRRSPARDARPDLGPRLMGERGYRRARMRPLARPTPETSSPGRTRSPG